MSAQTPAAFQSGDRVRVSNREHSGHHRTPWYIKGKVGTIDANNGVWLNPESRGHGGSGLPKVPVYRVMFEQTELWENYGGPERDKLIVDVFQHWLEPVQEGTSE